MIIYGILDSKSKGVQIVFPSVTDETAIRTFEHTLFAPEDSIFNRSPEDFSLYRIADIDFYGDPTVISQIVLLRSGNEYSRDFITLKRREAMDERRRILNVDNE